ncbi:zinc carboxypeptidase putativemetallo-peptidase Clan MC Family M14 [Leptomonas pyrrhocoris]|uniref:Zinc carboxypeptidase putativemetallo-peptidase Clan MC Family M14 n=1 Tax=Leptomonas pyrrhocoris TaxID=157538 RepID=A0A0M9G3K9_LEPPY|nr:zinc carboxypeptidase putativemetallo-peptidase Clan MC Family M14 [Leptomonas pyrrhocoris]KPA81436.1 zinc carboxypeptidase putativemetallo-peptidase Clan MC Family M14 [Leptomonas pyrrhocoris]|eukprot:XP_015659875.1 zinc carboxypeptidase putativemetallo-peptidase Clan MC Family M14 [Leptomonas pyrrhocoris]
MKRSQDVRRRTASASSATSTSTASIGAAPSAAVAPTKPIEGRGGNITPRQKQRAALRISVQQQGRDTDDTNSTRTEENTVSSSGVTVTSGPSNGAADLQQVDRHGEDGRHAAVVQGVTSSGATPPSASSTVTRTLSSGARKTACTSGNAAAAVPSATPAHSTALAVQPVKPIPRDNASPAAPRSLTVGTTLTTPPPAASISVSAKPAGSSRGVEATDGWTPRRNSSTVTQDVHSSPTSGPSPMSVASPLRQCSARRRDSGVNASLSSSRSQTTQASWRLDVPSVVKVAPRLRPGPPSPLEQQLLDEGYYLVSDGSVNSSFSDTPRSARPASLGSTSSRQTSMRVLDLNTGSRAAAISAGAVPPPPPIYGAGTPHQAVRQESGSGPGGGVGTSSSSEGSSSSGRSEVNVYEEDDGDVHYDEEDEEQAVLTYMDSGAEVSFRQRRSGSGRLPSPLTLRRSNGSVVDAVNSGAGAGEDGDEPHRSDDSGPPSRLSVSSPPRLYRRGTSSLRNHSPTQEPRLPTYIRTKSTAGGGNGGEMNTPPQASPVFSAKPAPAPPPPMSAGASLTSLSRQPSSRRSPHNRPASQSPVQTSPLNPFSLSPYGAAASADEETCERQCKLLSLHEAFFFNQSRRFWLVDDQVLAKVLEYVRLMGYEHPALKRDRSKGQPSLWSSSSAISSPIAPGKLKKKSAATPAAAAPLNASKELNGEAIPNPQTSPSAAAAALADAVSQSNPAAGGAVDGGAKDANVNNPNAFLGKQYHLKSVKPKCAGQYANTTSTSATHLFLTFNEALRWVVEQEYVIGAVLMCCARFIGDAEADGAAIIGDGTADGAAWHPRRAMLQRGKPCIPVRLHPIHFVASLVLTHYPQWGGMTAFMRIWETQIGLVLGSASSPHQRVFKCPDDGLILSSDLDAGNLHRVERAPEPYFFLIWLEPDKGSDKRIWFRFSVAGATEGRTLRFRLMNAAPHAKLYRQNGMMPVWRDGLSQVNWGPVDSCTFRTTNHDLDGEVCFSILVKNSTETIQIAFCAPYSYADLLCHVCHWHSLVKNSGCDMRFEERVLCRSPEGRKLHLLIITSRTGGPPKSSRENNQKVKGGGSSGAAGNANAQQGSGTAGGGGAAGAAGSALSAGNSNGTTGAAASNLISSPSTSSANKTKSAAAAEAVHGPYSNFSSGKKVILVSGRVHPGEVTASHGVHGLISFLLSSDPRAILLREHFIFFIVPMLNPDGVSRGHSRLDQFGNNLNRCYNDPDPETQPTVLALRCVFEHLQRTYRERFIMYLDFHSHASQSSGFMFGNNLPVRVQHWNVFFPRLVELHARHVFSFDLSRFGRVHMTSKDGASRVLFGSSLIHSYTVELTHFTDRRLYADDFAAMNNGSAVLLEVTWPPLHPAPGPSIDNGVEEAENSKGGSRSVNSASPPARAAPSGLDGCGGQRTNSSAVRSGKSQSLSMAGARQRAASAVAGAKHSTAAAATNGKGEAVAARKRGTSVGVSKRVASGRSRDTASTSASSLRLLRSGPLLQPVSSPSVLCQSAEVGKACLLALLDYCSIGRQSDELSAFGGMSRVLRDVKRRMKASAPSSPRKPKKSQAAATYAGIQPIYKQY